MYSIGASCLHHFRSVGESVRMDSAIVIQATEPLIPKPQSQEQFLPGTTRL